MEYLNRKIDQNYLKNDKFDSALERDLKLKEKIDREINSCDSLNEISFDSYNFYRVFEKIARGHTAYIGDCICINEEIKAKKYLNLLFKMSDKETKWFNELRGEHILWPEVYCRSYDILEEYGDVYPWINIEENKYRYNVCCYSDCFIVKIIMNEILFCAFAFFYE